MNKKLQEECRAHLEKRIMLELSGTTPRAFLLSVLTNNNVDIKYRIDAAKTLLPYTEAKVVEQPTKKEHENAISIRITTDLPQ